MRPRLLFAGPVADILRRIGALYSSAIFCVGLFSTFAGQLLLGKVLSAEDFGSYILVYSASAILSAVGAAGLDVSAVRFVSVAREKNDHAELRSFIAFALRLTGVLSIVAAACGALYLSWVGAVSGVILLLSSGVILIWGATRSLSGILRGMGGLSLAIGIDRVARDFAVFLVAAIMFALARATTLEDALTSLFIGGLVGLLIGALVLYRKFGNLAPVAMPTETHLNRKEWRSTSFGLMIYNLTELLSSRFDVVFLSIMIARDEIGVLGILIVLMNICAIPSVFAGIYIMPKIAMLWSTRDHTRLRQMYIWSTAASVGLGALIAILLLLVKNPIAHFFGTEFTRHISPEALGAAFAIRCLSLIGTFPAAFLTMTGGHKKLLVVNFGSMALRAMLYLIFSTQIGATLGVLAFACAALGVSLANFAIVRKQI